MLTDMGNRTLGMPIPQQPQHEPVATLVQRAPWEAYEPQPALSYHEHDWSQRVHLEVFQQPMPVDSMSYAASFHEGGFGDETPPMPPMRTGELRSRHSIDIAHFREQQDVMRQRLQEKRELLEASLMRYRQIGNQLQYSPDNHLLRQSHEEAEIEAAGYQAEVAVLSQHLNDLDEALRSQDDAMVGG